MHKSSTPRQNSQPVGFLEHFRTSFSPWTLVPGQSTAETFIPATHRAAAAWIAKQQTNLLVLMAETQGVMKGVKLLRGHLRGTRHIGIKLNINTKIEKLQPSPFLCIHVGNRPYVVWRLVNEVPIETAEAAAIALAAKFDGTPIGHLLPLPGTTYDGALVKLIHLYKNQVSVLTDFHGLKHNTPTTPTFVRAANVKAKPLLWLWRGAILRGALSLLAGPGGVGKSTVAASIAATVTTGGIFPDGEQAEVGSVIFCEGEDDPERVTLPRLQAAGADLSRVVIGPMCDLSQGLDPLEAAVKELGEPPSLLVLSPVRSFFGKETYIDTEVRARLASVLAWSEQHNVAVLGISHPPRDKRSIAGAAAWTNAARAGLFVEKNKRNPILRILSPLKANSGRDDWQLSYSIQGTTLRGGIETSHIVWQEKVERTNLAPPNVVHMHTSVVEWLRNQLSTGPKTATEIKAAATEIGISKGTLDRAATSLEIEKIGGGRFRVKTWSLKC